MLSRLGVSVLENKSDRYKCVDSYAETRFKTVLKKDYFLYKTRFNQILQYIPLKTFEIFLTVFYSNK